MADTTDQSKIYFPGEPKGYDSQGGSVDAPGAELTPDDGSTPNSSAGFTADENQGDTQQIAQPVAEPSDEAAEDLKAAQKKKK